MPAPHGSLVLGYALPQDWQHEQTIGRGVAGRMYPSDIRDSRGKEILGTLLDAGDASLAAFVRQLASLMVGGLVVRSRQALAEPPGKLAARTICWAASSP